MRLALDHHYSPAIARSLRDKGLDVVAAVEVGWEAETDASMLSICAEDQRALLTNNVADFVVLARRWSAGGRSHAGLVFTSDRAFPRTQAGIGALVTALGVLLRARPAADAFADRTHWL